jgi:transcriptional regulator with XRE-family HTH domain
MGKKDPALVTLGANLRKAREAREWSQEEMAARCGVHRTYVGGVERGEYNVTVLTLRQFTRALGIRLADAIRGVR